mgnify:CR=1 FL=1
MEEEEEEQYGQGRDGVEQADLEKTGAKEDLLACHKCKQFGHLSFQCMNMFS